MILKKRSAFLKKLIRGRRQGIIEPAATFDASINAKQFIFGCELSGCAMSKSVVKRRINQIVTHSNSASASLGKLRLTSYNPTTQI